MSDSRAKPSRFQKQIIRNDVKDLKDLKDSKDSIDSKDLKKQIIDNEDIIQNHNPLCGCNVPCGLRHNQEFT